MSGYLSTQDAVDHDNDEALQRVEDGEEDLEEGRAAVCDGQDSGHPGEGQERQNDTGTPQRCPEGEGGSVRAIRPHKGLRLLELDCESWHREDQ